MGKKSETIGCHNADGIMWCHRKPNVQNLNVQMTDENVINSEQK